MDGTCRYGAEYKAGQFGADRYTHRQETSLETRRRDRNARPPFKWAIDPWGRFGWGSEEFEAFGEEGDPRIRAEKLKETRERLHKGPPGV